MVRWFCTLFLVHIQCMVIYGCEGTISVVQKPSSLKMCRALCHRSSGLFNLIKEDLSCRRLSTTCPNNSRNTALDELYPSHNGSFPKDSITDPNYSLNASEVGKLKKNICQAFKTFTATKQPTENDTSTGNQGVIHCNKAINLPRYCRQGELASVQRILSQGLENIDCRGKKGRTPVLLAALWGQLNVFNFLVGQGSDLTVLDDDNNTCLHLACKRGKIGIIKYILNVQQYYINSKNVHGWTPAVTAAYYGQSEVFQLLYQKKRDLHETSSLHDAVIHAACVGGHKDVIQYILKETVYDIESRWFKGRTPVMEAAINGHLWAVKMLITKGCNLRVVDHTSKNILHVACVSGNVDLVKFILSLKIVDIDSREQTGRTPVMIASLFGKKEVVKLLINSGCNAKLRDIQNSSLLHLACFGGHVDLVNYILSKGIDDIERQGRGGRTPVMTACLAGHMRVVTLLVNRGCNPRFADREGYSMIHFACGACHVNLVKYILTEGLADIESRGFHGRTPLMTAIAYGCKGIVSFLLCKGSDTSVCDDNKDNILHLACMYGRADMVKFILLHDIVDVECGGYGGRSPVLTAAEHGHADVVKFLVSKGCDLYASDSNGNNVFHVSCMKGYIDMVKYFIAKNITNIDRRAYNGRTPLMMASVRGQGETVKLLLKKGCNPHYRDKEDNNILHLACIGGNVSVVKLILSLRITDIESKGHLGRTPVVIAAEQGHTDVVIFLLEQGCNPRVLDDLKNTILHVACNSGSTGLVNLILSRNLVSIDSRGFKQWTPVMLAAANGHVTVVEFLADKGCSMRSVDDRKRNILHLACAYGQETVVKYLMTLKVVQQIQHDKNDYGMTPVEDAETRGHKAVVSVLRGIRR